MNNIHFNRKENQVMYNTLQERIDWLLGSKHYHRLDDESISVWRDLQSRIQESDRRDKVFKRDIKFFKPLDIIEVWKIEID